MAFYNNSRKDSALEAVEFTPVPHGNFSFFYISAAERKEEMKSWLASQAVGQDIIAETLLNGKPVLITQGEKSQHDLMKTLETRGDSLQFHHHQRGLSEIAWPVRSVLGIAGQGLQLTSSLMRGKRDWGLFTFALANLTANGINILFGAQRTEDVNRLRFLKNEINTTLAPQLPEGKRLPDIDEQRAELRQEPERRKSTTQRTMGFLKRHSVSVGELGLRYLGAFSLVFPTSRWGKGFKELNAGNAAGAYQLARDPSALRHYAGLGSIAGKTTAQFSKTPDPYDPKPDSWLDTLREKFTFRTGGFMEMAAFATLSYDGFKNQKIQFRGKQYTDYLSGTGAALFTLAYLARNWAPFGVKETNMDELYAHVSDSLANMPPEKLPQLMADTTAHIKQHFKDKDIDFGMIFTQVMSDLSRYHHIALKKSPAAHAAAEPQEDISANHVERLQKRRSPNLSLVVKR